MRVAILSTFPDKKCGIGHYTKQLVDVLRVHNRIDKVVVIGDLESTKADYMVDFKSLSLYKPIKKIISKEQIDLLHIQHEYYLYGKTNLNILMVYYALDIPIVTKLSSLFSKNPNVPLLERLRAKIVERVVAKKSDKIIITTGASKDELRGFPSEKIIQIPLGISVKGKTKRRSKKDKNTILFFGVVSRHKGVEYLIRSAKYLENVKIIVAGKPNMDLKEIMSLKDKYSKYNDILLDLEWIPDRKRHEYFNDADVVVLPYTKTGFQSGVLYDAFSYGIPCVVSKGGRMGVVVEEHQLGATVNPMNPKDIASGINEVLGNYRRYQDNVSRYQKLANWNNVARMYIRAYESVM